MRLPAPKKKLIMNFRRFTKFGVFFSNKMTEIVQTETVLFSKRKHLSLTAFTWLFTLKEEKSPPYQTN